MNCEQIIEMAKKAGFLSDQFFDHEKELVSFAALVADSEREECAKAIQKRGNKLPCYLHDLIAEIEARGQQ